jgi:E3 ubiquitin-protein ligase RNF115/126
MDQPNNQPAQAQPQNPARRDMMFCHECADEWYRDQHGLTCPECGSDFTEIVS